MPLRYVKPKAPQNAGAFKNETSLNNVNKVYSLEFKVGSKQYHTTFIFKNKAIKRGSAVSYKRYRVVMLRQS